MSDDLAVVGLILVALAVTVVASYPAAALSGCIVGAFIRKQDRRPVRWAVWTNLLPALTAPVAVGGLAGILWALPQRPDPRAFVALASGVAASILLWSLVYRLAYRVPARPAVVGAFCVPLVAVPVTMVMAWVFGTMAAVLLAVFSS